MRKSYMKRFAGVLAGLLIIPMLVPQAVRAANPERQASAYRAEAVLVSNTAEFIEALEDNTTLVLEPEVYNITEFINTIKNPAVWNYEGGNEKGVYVDDETDGPQLMINGYKNVTIVAASSEAPASIVCEPRYADVLTFVDCDNITLRGLSIGHTPDQGYCSGEVISFEGCTNVKLDRLDLYGCGTYGFVLSDCENVEVSSCDIHDCTYGCAEIFSSQAVSIVHTGFHDCKEFTMFDLIGSSVDFIGCSFYNLEGTFIYSQYSDATFTACDLEPEMEKELKELGFLADEKAEASDKKDDKSTDTKEDDKKEEPKENIEAKDLTDKELKDLSETMMKDYDGFFCSTYARPEEIDWNEVFYNGAGIDIDIYADENEKILNDYLEESEYESQEDMMTDVTVIPEEAVMDYIKETTGLSYDELWRQFTWGYLFDDEVYYSEHGDTNYRDVNFSEGTLFGDTYRVKYPTYDFMYEEREYMATFEKTKDGWHFISNVPTDWVDTETDEIRDDLPIAGFYGTIIRNYLSTLRWEPDEMEMYYNNVSVPLLYLFDDVTFEDGPGAVYDRIGLYFKDLNNDGFDELIIGVTGEDGSYDNIYQIYSQYEGAPGLMFEAPYRGEAALTADGQIAEITADSLYFMSKFRYEVRDDGILWVTEGAYMEDEAYWSVDEDAEEDKHYYAFDQYVDETVHWMEAEITWKDITEEEFDDIDVFTGAVHIPYQMTLKDTDSSIQSAEMIDDLRLGYTAGLGDSNKRDSWFDADNKEYVDAYDYDGIDIRLGRLAWLESIDDIGDVIENQLDQKPENIEVSQLREDVAKSMYGADFVIYNVTYTSKDDGNPRENFDLVFMAPEAMYWFHAGMPADMADRYYMEMVEDIESGLVLEKWTDEDILGEYEPKG